MVVVTIAESQQNSRGRTRRGGDSCSRTITTEFTAFYKTHFFVISSMTRGGKDSSDRPKKNGKITIVRVFRSAPSPRDTPQGRPPGVV